MKAITLRNIPPDVARAVERRASREGQSLNKAVLELVAEGAGLKNRARRVRHTDLDSLFGKWSKEQADEFDNQLCELRTVDSEVWK